MLLCIKGVRVIDYMSGNLKIQHKSAFIDSSRIKHCKWRDLLYDNMKGTSRNDFTG